MKVRMSKEGGAPSAGLKPAYLLASSLILLASSSMVGAAEFWDEIVKVSAIPSITPPMSNHDERMLDSLEPIGHVEMETLRGGFVIAGIDMNFGATLRTVVDNVRMDTVFSITKAGSQITSQTVSHADASTLQGVTLVGDGTGQTLVALTPAGINLAGMKDFSGLVLNDSKGFTSVLHNVTQNSIVGSVVSDASNRDIQQQLNVGIQINNLPALQAAKQGMDIMNSLSR